MSLFIGLITNESVYIGADARGIGEIPYLGKKKYDFIQKLGSFSNKGNLWATHVGLGEATCRVFYEIESKYNIQTIDDLLNIEVELFKKCHEEILRSYNTTYRGFEDLQNCLTILFGGIGNDNKPKMCLVDSANDYKKQWFNKPGDFVVNRIDNGEEIDKYLSENISRLSNQILQNDDFSFVLTEFKKLFSYASKHDIGISPLMYFTKIYSNGYEYKEFYFLRRFIDKIRYNFDTLLYFKILKLDKKEII